MPAMSDETERSREQGAQPTLASDNGTIGTTPPVGFVRWMSTQVYETDCSGHDGQHERFEEHQPDNSTAGKPKRLQNGQFVRQFPNGLRHRVTAEDQDNHEQHWTEDRDHNRPDVTNLLGNGPDERVLG